MNLHELLYVALVGRADIIALAVHAVLDSFHRAYSVAYRQVDAFPAPVVIEYVGSVQLPVQQGGVHVSDGAVLLDFPYGVLPVAYGLPASVSVSFGIE